MKKFDKKDLLKTFANKNKILERIILNKSIFGCLRKRVRSVAFFQKLRRVKMKNYFLLFSPQTQTDILCSFIFKRKSLVFGASNHAFLKLSPSQNVLWAIGNINFFFLRKYRILGLLFQRFFLFLKKLEFDSFDLLRIFKNKLS